MNRAQVLETAVFDVLHLFGRQQTHRGWVFEHEFVCRFSAVDEVGVDEFGVAEVVEEDAAGLDVAVTGAPFGQELQHVHHCPEDAHDLFLGDGLVHGAVLLDDVLQGAGEVGVLEV